MRSKAAKLTAHDNLGTSCRFLNFSVEGKSRVDDMPRANAQIGYSNRMRAILFRAAQARIGQELKTYYEPPRELSSAAVQAVVSHSEMSRLLPDDSRRSIAIALGLGAASSSSSYAAVALARPLDLPQGRQLHRGHGVRNWRPLILSSNSALS